MNGQLRIVVLGMMGRLPLGGHSWVFINWLSGLHQLGHDVWYVEDDLTWPYDPERNTVTDDCVYAVRHVRESLERIGLEDRWAYRLVGVDGACWGMASQDLDALYASCDVIINLEGGTELREEHMAAPMRVYVETDPVLAEIRIAEGEPDSLVGHEIIATYGENFGSADCRVPLPDYRFVKTRQPIDLNLWPVVAGEPRHFTTIGNYRQRGNDLRFEGQTYYWSKHVEWDKVLDLPRRTQQTFQMATMASVRDRRRLHANGWEVVDPLHMSIDVFGAYRDFIGGSRAELTVAKDMNVRLRSGWFSERDASYLASGRPVVAQDTGFSNVYPTGDGLFAFLDRDEALDAVEAINADYAHHCRAARELAEEFFAAPRVANRLLEDVGLS